MNLQKLSIAALLILFGVVAYAQPYNYPVRPGDEEWKNFNNSTEMYLACEIPTNVINSLSTRDLVSSVLNYPMIGTIYAYDNPQAGFNSLVEKSNAFKELLHREDAGRELINVYIKMNPDRFDNSWTEIKKGEYSLGFSYIEIILAQEEILKNLTFYERKNLVRLCLDKYDKKNSHKNIYSTYGLSTSIWVVNRIMEEGKPISDMDNYAFYKYGLVTNFDVFNAVVSKARNYIK